MGHSSGMNPPRLSSLLVRLDLQAVDEGVYRGFTPNDGRPRVFGGLVAAQALVAASRTVPDKQPHSLHSYFLRPGDPASPIDYVVDPIREGKSFATRRVVARQGDEAIFELSASFHQEETGLDHQAPMPAAPPPETVVTNAERLEELGERTGKKVFGFLLSMERPIEHRDPEWVDPLAPGRQTGPRAFWFRADGEMPDDPLLHRAVLTYATDMGLLDNCIQYHGYGWLSPELMIASLDHVVWFHRPLRVDGWLLYVTDSPSAHGGRGLNLGRIYDREGRLVASVAQESLMRLRQ
jgi:acyl-CoA thioesterase-2